MTFCTHCGATVVPGASFCASCGHAMVARPAAPPMPAATVTIPPSANATNVNVHVSAPAAPAASGLAIVALLLNIFVWPGLGSLVAGQKIGWTQGFLALLGVVLIVSIVGIFLGIPLLIAMWIWGIVTGVQLISHANAMSPQASA